MNRREFAAGLIAMPAFIRTASAEVSSIVLGKQYGLPFLPQMVMEDQKLIEKHAAALGDARAGSSRIRGGDRTLHRSKSRRPHETE